MQSRSFRSALRTVVCGSVMAALLVPGVSQALETKAREAYIMDYDTKTVLLSKDASRPMPPASMSKIMTAFMVFERLQDGRLSLDDKLPVSEKAWRKGGSKMFVEVGDEIAIRDLLRGIIVQSGNDACIVVAEGLAGSEDAFAELMTEKARELGLENSTFANATGWPDPNQRMAAEDLAKLADIIITRFPEYYHIFSEASFTWSGIEQNNRNPLLYRNIGSDGLKTGHTEEAGYGLTSSAVQGDRRIVMVVNGLGSTKERAEESVRLMSWAFREFDNFDLLKAGEIVEEAPVWLGTEKTVGLSPERDLVLTLPKSAKSTMTATVVYEGPIQTPIEQGQRLGLIRIEAEGLEPTEVPLVATRSVDRQGGFGRIVSALNFLIFGQP
ncbi:D-alanyl-D-alanine carboxypeptidase family protein [Kiloniella sp. b19]|uniref:D-alanyl-D-alanine carboxypeptidase family protein n=1 Tax=Kiloniella sp. GXU_MW_B19 TaxID=3141326 RepID=UPI0031D79A1A